MKDLLVVGAGFAGAVLAREIAEAGFEVTVIDRCDHVAGHCHTYRDLATGVMVHAHGPHVFHTRDASVWEYVQRFGSWMPYVNRIKARTAQGLLSLPVNLLTINQFFGKTFSPSEARAFIAGKAMRPASGDEPANFEEQALSLVGPELYEAVFRGYTLKQWGCDPTELPASVFSRLPVRFDDNESYYDSIYQGVPRDGYTRVIENILDHPGVHLMLGVAWDPAFRRDSSHVFFSGPLDGFYGHSEGRLGYRTVSWDRQEHDGDFQGAAIINDTRAEIPWTRTLEFKHLAPWEFHARSVVCREYSRETGPGDVPYYPKRLEADLRRLERYVERAHQDRQVSFLGRLGTYRYLDMHQVIGESRVFARSWVRSRLAGRDPPVFSADPLARRQVDTLTTLPIHRGA